MMGPTFYNLFLSTILRSILVALGSCCVTPPSYLTDILTLSYCYRSSTLQILTGDTYDGNPKSIPLQIDNQLLDTGHPTVPH